MTTVRPTMDLACGWARFNRSYLLPSATMNAVRTKPMPAHLPEIAQAEGINARASAEEKDTHKDCSDNNSSSNQTTLCHEIHSHPRCDLSSFRGRAR